MTQMNMQTIKQSLQDMIQYCKGIHSLLSSDVASLSKNAISDIKASNEKKEILVENLNQLSHHLTAIAPDSSANPLDKVIELAKSYDHASRMEIQQLVDTLKAEIVKAYETLTVNSSILTSHIHSTKTLWDNLMACRPSASCVYDSKGNTHK